MQRIPTEEELDKVARRVGAKLDALTVNLSWYWPDTPSMVERHRAADYTRWVRKWFYRAR